MIHGSLFSGIGGFDIAAEWMGWENKFHCEINEFGQKVLKYYWPDAELFSDITKTDFTKYANKIDVLSGGFPCQPFSQAGKRKGIEDARHLWPEMLRAIREISPRYVVGENVSGLINWDRGLVFEQVQADLEAARYECQAYVLPACAVNAPHRRDRVWFIAHAINNGYRSIGKQNREADSVSEIGGKALYTREPNGTIAGITPNTGSEQFQERTQERNGKDSEKEGTGMDDRIERSGDIGNAANSERIGQPGQGRAKKPGDTTPYGNGKASWSYDVGRWPTESPLCSRDDGLSTGLAGITFSKHRTESIKGYGNAIVPQVAFEIFKAIEKLNRCNS